jgi:hypothetical protein
MTSIAPIGVFNNSYLSPKKKVDNENQNKEFEAYKEQTNNHIMQHEQAHKTAGGALAGSIVIEKNSDGVAYAGHVPIQIPEVVEGGNIEETKKQNEQVKTSAMAPSDPSGQDYLVAAQAQANINKALMLMKQKQC